MYVNIIISQRCLREWIASHCASVSSRQVNEDMGTLQMKDASFNGMLKSAEFKCGRKILEDDPHPEETSHHRQGP